MNTLIAPNHTPDAFSSCSQLRSSSSIPGAHTALVPRHDLLGALPDDELLERVHALAGRERRVTADLIAHLAEVDLRRLYLGRGCSSMFTYCTEVLRLPESAAYARIEVARAARRFPGLYQHLADGSLSLTSIRRLAPLLTPESFDRLVVAARDRTAREVDELVARERPKPDVRSRIRRVRRRTEHVSKRVEPGLLDVLDLSLSSQATAPARGPDVVTAPERTRASIQPLAPERFHVQFTASSEMRERIDRARDLLRHRIPDGDLAAVIDTALIELLAKLERQKCGALTRPLTKRPAKKPVTSPSKAPGAPRVTRPASRDVKPPAECPRDVALPARFDRPTNSRAIPCEVQRDVWRRDDGRCAFNSKDGKRCSATGFIEFHHVTPFAHGGEATVANIELRCRAHNAWEADRVGLGRRGL